MNRPSGDQKGASPPSVPLSGSTDAELNGLNHSWVAPWRSARTSNSVFPSGETLGHLSAFLSGGETTELISKGGCRLASRRKATVVAKETIASVAAPPHAIRSRFRPCLTSGAATLACELPSATHFSSLARSLALCHRSSGLLARHFLIEYSKAGGASGFTVLIGAGSFSRIAEATLSWLFPSNARRPVYISYSTAPNAKMSLRPSRSFPSTCSGDMYWNVPTIVPCSVTGELGVVAVSVAAELKAT